MPCVATVLPCIAISPRSKPSSFSTGTIRGCHSHRFGMTHWMPLTAANGGGMWWGFALRAGYAQTRRPAGGPRPAARCFKQGVFWVSENVETAFKGLEPHFPQVNGIVYIHIHYYYIYIIIHIYIYIYILLLYILFLYIYISYIIYHISHIYIYIIYLSIYLSIHPSIYLSIYLSICVCVWQLEFVAVLRKP